MRGVLLRSVVTAAAIALVGACSASGDPGGEVSADGGGQGGSGGGKGGSGGSGGGGDLDGEAGDVATDADVDVVESGGGTGGTGGDSGADDVPDSDDDVLMVDGGMLGDPCANSSDCVSGECLEGPTGGLACSQKCVDSCPDGWRCAVLPNSSDGGGYCVPRFARLCRPCQFDEDCRLGNAPSESSRCVPSGGEGSFCGATCSSTLPCPAGYTCKVVNIGSALFNQCVPLGDALCKCDESWVGKGYKTACYVENGYGKCTAERSCDTGTLPACTARTPAAEVCDGIDNNCNGMVDDGNLCNDGVSCTVDSCVGGECVYTPAAGRCAIDFACYNEGPRPGSLCQKCDPAVNAKAWTIVQDQYENNNTFSSNRWVGLTDNKPNNILKVNATLSGETDIDWYSANVAYYSSYKVEPRLSVNSGGASITACMYIKCQDGNALVMPSGNAGCTGGTRSATLNAEGAQGCCQTGANPSFSINFESCGGVGGDFALYAYLNIYTAQMLECVSYDITANF